MKRLVGVDKADVDQACVPEPTADAYIDQSSERGFSDGVIDSGMAEGDHTVLCIQTHG